MVSGMSISQKTNGILERGGNMLLSKHQLLLHLFQGLALSGLDDELDSLAHMTGGDWLKT